MLRIMSVFGTRPEAIKMAPIIVALNDHDDIHSSICLTAQHREMLDQVMSVFKLRPDYDLNIMVAHQSLESITINILGKMGKILDEEKPNVVLVHGDTTTSFATALACFYRKIPVGHVEAGLRTYNLQSPYPEEFNRQAVDIISNILYAPTNTAKKNLIQSGRNLEEIIVTGNTVIDALRMTISNDFMDENLTWVKNSRLILLTAHRRENWGRPMKDIFRAVKRILDLFDDVKCIFPIHMNPIIRETADEIFEGEDKIRIIEPLDVVAFHNYMARCYFVLTDSGGIQEEAPALGKPVLVLRNTTERPEGIEAGTIKLAGTSEQGVFTSIKELLTNDELYKRMSEAVNPYGDGNAANRIVADLINRFK